MNKILTSLFTLSIVAASSVSLAQPTPTGPRYLGVPSVSASGGLSSNAVYDMIINYNVGSTGGISAATATNIAAYQIGLSNGNYIARSSGWGTNLSLNGSIVTTNQTGMTNSKAAIVDGGIHLSSALFGGSWPIARGTNYYGGQINWWHQTDTFPPPSEGGTTYTPMGAIGTFEQWGSAAVSAISPWMLITAPNIRIEQGYGAGYGEIALGNEDAAGSIYLNWNRGPTLTQYGTANYKGFSFPLSFEADVTDASVNHHRVFPGIIGYAPDYNANADPNSGLRQGELYFQSLTAYRLNGGWAQNGANAFGSNTVFRMRTNMVTFDGTLGVNGTSKTHIDGGSITNTDIISKIIGTDSNGKFTGATLSGLTWDGTTLTASAGGTSYWNTNATDGKITNILGGVSVGASSLNVSNGTASFINLLNSPATPSIMVGGNQTSFVTVNTNSIAGTNGANYSVMDAAGTFTNSVRVKTSEVQASDVYGARVRAGTPSLPAPGLWGTGSGDYALRLPINGRIVWTTGNTDYYTPSTGAVISNLASGLQLSTNLTVSGSVTATDGFFLPQLSGIPSGVDLRSSSGNTNWLQLNLGGDVALLKTNAAASGSYVTNWLTKAGSLVESKVASGSAVSLVTATTANITSISIEPGTWRVSGNVNMAILPGTSGLGYCGISTTSATMPTDGTETQFAMVGDSTSALGGSATGVKQITVTTTTTVYLVAKSTFATSGTAFGSISATLIK